jgi:hypothetical protein
MAPKDSQKALLPILIIPGFMSSGLEIQESALKPNWKGQRLWINLSSLGLQSLYFGRSTVAGDPNNVDEDDPTVREYRKFKSAWLQHMLLKSDMKTEHDGVKVRAIQGLEGVDYLSPGALTNQISYVFGPFIRALQQAGYNCGENINLEAAPYDCRLPPSHLEVRDSYFSNVITQVEGLYSKNNDMPVVLLCHSLGTKTCHYFLTFAKREKGQAWLDKYIHTYLPVGGPHLGAPKALRSVISGDKMSLDAFLSDEEALSMGRSLGSGPWLFPETLPDGVPGCVYLRPNGVLQVSFVGDISADDLVKARRAISKPNRYRLAVAFGSSKRVVMTPFKVSDSLDQVSFASEKIFFATKVNPKENQNQTENTLQFVLQEPGIAAAKYEKKEKPEKQETKCNPLWCLLKFLTCWCIIEYIYCLLLCLLKFLTCWCITGYIFNLLGCLTQSLVVSADAISSTVGGSTTLAFTEPVPLNNKVWSGKPVKFELQLYHKDDHETEGFLCCLSHVQRRASTIKIEIQFIPYNNTKSFRKICSPVARPSSDGSSTLQLGVKAKGVDCQEFSGYDILEREGLEDILRVIKTTYDDDAKMGPRSVSSYQPPPVKRVHSIYGINLPTEMAGVYKRKDACLSNDRLRNLYKLDSKATVDQASGYTVRGGLMFETKHTKQTVAGGRCVSGDGTVPYWSLQHAKSWHGPSCEVSVLELEGAEHREILADARFHQAVLDYCRQEAGKLMETPNIVVEEGDIENQALEVSAAKILTCR